MLIPISWNDSVTNETASVVIEEHCKGSSVFIFVKHPFLPGAKELLDTANTHLRHTGHKESGDGLRVRLDYLYLDPSQDIDVYRHILETKDFDYINPLLYPGVDVKALASSFVQSRENVLILFGEPGTGKTTFIKYCMNMFSKYWGRDVEATYVKDKVLLEKESLWSHLTSRNNDVLILDDLDFALLPRSSSKQNSFMSSMLSFSDGLFDIKTKIIITTNKELSEIDSAITRPGRCFDILKLPFLTRDEAKHIWITSLRMKEESFDHSFSEERGSISQAELMATKYKVDKSLESHKYLTNPLLSLKGRYVEKES